jgi:hypothetical protein
MSRSAYRAVVGIWLVAVLGCGDDPFYPRSPTLSIRSGDQQVGKAGADLAEALVVSVTDQDGKGVSHATVDWSVTSGRGVFWSWEEWEIEQVGSLSSRTGNSGLTSASFVPLALGRTIVTARATSFSGVDVGSVTFTVTTDTLLIPVGDRVDWKLSWPDGPREVEVPVGTPVEWISEGRSSIASTATPAGGASFDSGTLEEGESFRFVPEVPGTWAYRDQITGNSATLTAH